MTRVLREDSIEECDLYYCEWRNATIWTCAAQSAPKMFAQRAERCLIVCTSEQLGFHSILFDTDTKIGALKI